MCILFLCNDFDVSMSLFKNFRGAHLRSSEMSEQRPNLVTWHTERKSRTVSDFPFGHIFLSLSIRKVRYLERHCMGSVQYMKVGSKMSYMSSFWRKVRQVSLNLQICNAVLLAICSEKVTIKYFCMHPLWMSWRAFRPCLTSICTVPEMWSACCRSEK